MNKYEMLTVIVLILVAGGILIHFFKSHNEEAEKTSKQFDDKRLRQQEAHEQSLKQLEMRIEVLEQILTSDGYDLQQRFKELSDDQQEEN